MLGGMQPYPLCLTRTAARSTLANGLFQIGKGNITVKSFWKSLVTLCIMAVPLFAGRIALEVGSPGLKPRSASQYVVLVARITACHSPEKTTVLAAAEGVLDGVRQSIPLKVIPLSTAGTFAVAGEWPQKGNWAVTMIATNPDYKDYATSVVVPMQNGSAQFSAAKHYFRKPTDAEVFLALN